MHKKCIQKYLQKATIFFLKLKLKNILVTACGKHAASSSLYARKEHFEKQNN